MNHSLKPALTIIVIYVHSPIMRTDIEWRERCDENAMFCVNMKEKDCQLASWCGSGVVVSCRA